MQPARTKTGQFPIGFRKLRSDWQSDPAALAQWSRQNRFGFIELGNNADQIASRFLDAGLPLHVADLPEWRGMISADPETRRSAVERNGDYIRSCQELGIEIFLCVMVPEDPVRPSLENLGYAVDSYRKLAPVLTKTQSRVVIEGFPAPGALCCTPESCRIFFGEIASAEIGINYDPSHLVRMGIDPLRYLNEFAGRIFHVHAKDTRIDPDAQYQYGWTVAPIAKECPKWTGPYWQYTIPGHGELNWTDVLRILCDNGYKGAISVELEDIDFNGSPSGEQRGLVLARDCLEKS